MSYPKNSVLALLALLHVPVLIADSVEPSPKRKAAPVEHIVSTPDKGHELGGDINEAFADNAEQNDSMDWSELWE